MSFEEECHGKYCCTCCPECYPDKSNNIRKQRVKEAIIKSRENIKFGDSYLIDELELMKTLGLEEEE